MAPRIEKRIQHKSNLLKTKFNISKNPTNLFQSTTICDVSSPPPNIEKPETFPAIPDTGCSGHYIMTSDPVSNLKIALHPLEVTLPNKQIIKSTHTGLLDIPELPITARECHIFPDLGSGSLLSIGLLCDHDVEVLFLKTKVQVFYHGKEILTGRRDYTNGLWTIPMSVPKIKQNPCNAVTTTVTQTVAERVAFYHAALFSPTMSTWCKAIDAGHFVSWPELTSKQVRTHLPTTLATLKGHMDQTRANAQSTKRPQIPAHLLNPQEHPPSAAAANVTDVPPSTTEVDDSHPPAMGGSDTPGKRTHHMFASLHDAKGQIFTDQPGRFLVPSSAGNEYFLLLYDYDSNYIHAEPMPSRTAKSIVKAYSKAHATLVTAGLRPQLQRLDNEASALLQQFMQDENIDFQLAPPHLHRRNAAERAIRTYKNHLIAGLSSTDPDFPLHLWDRLIPQSLISLNLMRGSRMNPKLSAYAQVHGAFDFNRTPIAPPGTKVLVHEKPDVRGTWSPHAVEGWYVGPASNHYRCYRVWIKETAAERIADTLTWMPLHVKMPGATPTEAATAAARDLIAALVNPATPSPLAPLSDSHRQALYQLADIFASITHPIPINPPTEPISPPTPVAAVPLKTVTFQLPQDKTAPHDHSQWNHQRMNTPWPKPADTVAPPRVPRSLVAPPTLPRVPTVPTAPTSAAPPRVRKRKPTTPPQRPKSAPKARRPRNRSAKASPSTTPVTTTAQLLPATYASLTGNMGKARRARKKKLQQARRKTHAKGKPIPSPPVTRSHLHRSTRGKKLKILATINQAIAIRALPELSAPLLNAVINPITGENQELRHLLQGPESAEWWASNANEFGRLTQGVLPHMPTGTETMRFIKHTAVPADRKATYARFVCDERPLKTETKRVRITVGGDKIDYPGKVATPTAELVTVKCLFNSVVSTPGAKCMSADAKDFYLGTPMERPEFMRIPLKMIPQVIIDQYNLLPLVHNGYVMVEINKGMYGLPQAGILANKRLVKHLASHGYVKAPRTPGLFTHVTRPVTFCLVVDDFAIKYVGKEHADHLLACLREQYTMTTDWECSNYIGLTVEWDYDKRTCDISLPGYVKRAIHRFQHISPRKPQHAPSKFTPPNYGAKQQLTELEDASDLLDASGKQRIQEIVGVLLYYARAIDSTMLVALGTIASARTTETTAKAVAHLLNYAASNPDAKVRYHASGMCLKIHSDASYLSEPKARSRAGGHFFLSSNSPLPTATSVPPPENGAIHTLCSIMKMVLASATEAELGACFFNAKEGVMIRIILEEMGHPQPTTPIQVDNSCAAGIANDTVKQRRSKAIDMRFYWLKDRECQGQFHIHWRSGKENLADYQTKHFSAAHHRRMRPTYLHQPARSQFIPAKVNVSGEGVLIPGLSPIRVPSPNIRVTSRNILRPLTAAHPNTCLAHNII
jgi:hypothetical protein